MSLEEYNKKRDFSKTKEPEGKKQNENLKIQNSKPFRFVIQKHEATRLHYDFRIEHNGVLVSWAVPKGLPYKSAEKHLAMHVEDHPVSYYDFEGVIPEGNYGAGNVIVWDMGNYWVPHAETKEEVEEKISEGLKKGEVKLILNGEKVKGLFALVRFKKAGENAWLMIKDKDEYEGKNFMLKEKSVKSGKTLKQIEKTGSVEKTKLEFISPMKATLGQKAFNNPEFLFEDKLDGYRVIAVIDKKKVQLYSRNGESLNKKFSNIVDELVKLNITAILDGEVVAYDKKGKASFQMIQNHADSAKLIYHVFDILNLNGIDTTSLPLIERKKFLKKVIKNKSHIRITNYVLEKGEQLFKKSLNNHEGIIAKKLDSKYVAGDRSSEWIKIKNVMREEFVIGGITKPNGSRSGFGSLIIGTYKKNRLIFAGHIGTGFDNKMIHSLMKSFEKIKRKDSPFTDYKGDKTVQFFVEPIIICEANFVEWTNDGKVRQGSFIGIRTDKLPVQVKGDDSPLNIVTNPNKIFWPERKYTKLDLAKYYLEIAPILLPYLKDRPQNMNRQPDGITGKGFFHKDIEFKLPDFVETVDIKRDEPKEDQDGKGKDREITYLLCQNVESLIYMANLGCIEINPWLCRISDLDKPDFLVFDIDPNDVEFNTVVKTAKKMYEFLEELGIKTVIKTSGKRGIHLYANAGAKYTFEETKSFAEITAKIFAQKYPEIISLERSPNDRKGKIYIDYLQNRRGQTTASVYSVRPTLEASVSTPIEFNVLNSKLDPLKFDIKNTLKRIEKKGDLWKGIWKNEIDLEKALKKLKNMQK